MFKSGFVTIIGRPNVGKSTLLNRLMGEKLSIVSDKPQTTRNNIQTILNGESYQIVFVDTPGIHKPEHKLGEYMDKEAEGSVKDVDVIIFMTTPHDTFGKGDKFILDQIKGVNIPVILALNKIDEVSREKTAQSLKSYADEFDFNEIVPISALEGENVDQLKNTIIKYLSEGPKYYPDDVIINKEERFIVSEAIREKTLRFLRDEVPHGIAVDILSMKRNDSGEISVEANVICERESHKGIIIGKNGAMLKKIRKAAQSDLKKFFNNKVELNIWVKVRKDWRDKQEFLKDFGYTK